MTSAFLPDRASILIEGADAVSFLQGLITADIESLPEGHSIPGALLTPQGKILFEFLVRRHGTGLALETALYERDALIRRLSMYKLRASVDISAGDNIGVSVFWDGDHPVGAVLDERFRRAGVDVWRVDGTAGAEPESAYHALRVQHGIAEAGQDFALQDAFPHDVMMDLNGGVAFGKGCFVGQEVVSRMKHRGTARRRVAIVEASVPLGPSGTELTAGGKPVGSLGTVSGPTGLAVVRIDRAGQAMATATPVLAGDVPVTLRLPAWSGLVFPTSADEASA